jgi:hypothetical protein
MDIECGLGVYFTVSDCNMCLTHIFYDVATIMFVMLAVSAGNHAHFVCTNMYVTGRWLLHNLKVVHKRI